MGNITDKNLYIYIPYIVSTGLMVNLVSQNNIID